MSESVLRRERLRLGVILLAAMVPVLAGTAVHSYKVVDYLFVAMFALAGVWAWVRGARPHPLAGIPIAVAALVVALSSPRIAVWTLVAGLAAACLFALREEQVPWVRGKLVPALAPAVLIGVVWALVNVALIRFQGWTEGDMTWWESIRDALRAGLSEEIGTRLPLFAACMVAAPNAVSERWGRMLLYLVLIVPHASMHYVYEPSMMLMGTVVLGTVFGMPLCWLMVRRGVVAAVVAHTIIDLVRFLVVGV